MERKEFNSNLLCESLLYLWVFHMRVCILVHRTRPENAFRIIYDLLIICHRGDGATVKPNEKCNAHANIFSKSGPRYTIRLQAEVHK